MDKLPHSAGVYQITSSVDGRFYIGSTKDFYVRWRDHQSALRGGYHYNVQMQRIVDKYGMGVLTCEIVAETDPDDRVALEQWYIDSWHPELNGARMADGGFAGPHTDEAKAKMSAARQDQPPMSDETRRKISEAKMGHTYNHGVPKSPEHRKAIGDANRGKPHPSNREITEADRERARRLGHANRGRKASPETKAKMSATRKGRKHSEETKAKIAETNRITWETRRRQSAGTDSESSQREATDGTNDSG